MKLKLVIIISTLLLGSCALPHPAAPKPTEAQFKQVQTIPDEKALVYFYRPAFTFNWGGYANLFIDDEKQFPLKNNSYGFVFLDGGTYEVKFEGSTWGTNWYPEPAIAELSVEPGREYYIRLLPLPADSPTHGKYLPGIIHLTVTATAYFNAHTQISQIEKSLALEEIKLTNLVE